jgi:hypothetical protein
MVGTAVGLLEGCADGDTLGLTEGIAVGNADGTRLGAIDASIVDELLNILNIGVTAAPRCTICIVDVSLYDTGTVIRKGSSDNVNPTGRTVKKRSEFVDSNNSCSGWSVTHPISSASSKTVSFEQKILFVPEIRTCRSMAPDCALARTTDTAVRFPESTTTSISRNKTPSTKATSLT